jgi:vacuolar-type H+-ATPase subunit C/Vma6
MLIWVQRKYQKENLKTLLRLHAGEADRNMAERLLIPIEPFTVELLLTLYDSADLDQLAANIPDEFFKRVVGEAVSVYEETKDLMTLEHTLDAEVYENLFEKAQSLGGPDRRHTEKLIGVEIDMINMLTTLRSHLLQLDKTKAKELLLTKEHHLKQDVAKQAIDARTLEDAVSLLAVGHYLKFVKTAWEAYQVQETLRVFEHAFQTQILNASHEAMLGDPFHFGVILGYLNRKWFEIMNLKALMHGKAEKLDPNVIRRTLIL